jgi:PTS system mannitol-specific IIA component/phosphocarrier protein FPr
VADSSTAAGHEGAASEVLTSDAVRLGRTATDKWDVVRQAGELLVEIGAVTPEYADAMIEREKSVSTYIGEGVAIPHGTDESRAYVRRTALGVLQFPDGVDWDGDQVTVAVAIASQGHEHVAVLQALAEILMEPDQAERLRGATDPDDVVALLSDISTEEDS